ncbi:MAG TPA: helix-turn-helix domain-containing protein [Acholeplasmataceae bacterium]|jgi:DNA-binding PucR family transcriptional regulator|nr:helix-turn-helix domain-containing protein [Acholeplasmataceae bacterium]
MYQYFILQSKKPIKKEREMLLSLLGEVVDVSYLDVDNEFITVVFENLLESSLQELSQVIIEEFFIEIRIYESIRFETIHDLERNIKKVKRMLKLITFDSDDSYLNEVDLLYFEISKPIDSSYKKNILKKYSDDTEMKNILKVFFECNQNTSEASKRLYMHRNTLIQKLDKFYEETGFNPRKFKDAMIIYKAIEN